MAEVKDLLKIIHLIALLFWGLNIVEIVKKSFIYGMSNSLGGVFEDTIKLFMAIAGLVYFIIKILHAYKSNKLDRIIKQQQIDKTDFENKILMIEQHKKTIENNETK